MTDVVKKIDKEISQSNTACFEFGSFVLVLSCGVVLGLAAVEITNQF